MRFDKYEPKTGGFRAALYAARGKATGAVGSGATAAIGVGLDSSGRVVVGAGNTGILGVICPSSAMAAGDIIDVMNDGDIVDFGGTAGTVYYADTTTGVIGTGGGVGKVRIGHTVEAGRLVVRVDRGADTVATVVVGDQAAVVSLTNNTGVAGNDTVEDVPAVVAAAGEATAADLTTTQASFTAVENNIADLTDKLNVVIDRLEVAGLLTVTP